MKSYDVLPVTAGVLTLPGDKQGQEAARLFVEARQKTYQYTFCENKPAEAAKKEAQMWKRIAIILAVAIGFALIESVGLWLDRT